MPLTRFALSLYTDWLGDTPPTPPDPGDMTVYPIPQAVEYSPGQRREYWDYTELFQGFSAITYIWTRLGENDVKAFRQLYKDNKANPLFWLGFFNGQTGLWEISSGIMEEPHHETLTGGGDVSNGFKITFGKLGLHRNTPLDGPDIFANLAAGDVYTYGA